MNPLSRGLAPLAVLFVVLLGATVPAAAAIEGPSIGDTDPVTGASGGGADTEVEGTSDDEGVNSTVTTPTPTPTLLNDSGGGHEAGEAVDGEENGSTLLDVIDIESEEEDAPTTDGMELVDDEFSTPLDLSLTDSDEQASAGGAPTGLQPVPFGARAGPEQREPTEVERRSAGPDDDPPGDIPTDDLAVGAGAGALLLAGVVRQGGLSGLAAGSTLSNAASMAVDRLGRFLTVFRYSRYDDSDPLEHETRRTVYEAIEAEPGAYLSAVSEATGVPLSTARHHVRVLEREELVISAKVRGKRRFYASDAEDPEFAAAMNDGPTATVLDALARLGPCSVAALADDLGRDSSTVTHHLQRLDDDGLVERERDGRSVVNRLTPAARELLGHERAEQGFVSPLPADD